eukprot:GHVU01217681.1.p1 GENE.GHVU01217681.1~~GHVU01217681.1.p1  ORF type:complete len:318 (-),score=47.84 GHVU01217681.1:1000-1953(-)
MIRRRFKSTVLLLMQEVLIICFVEQLGVVGTPAVDGGRCIVMHPHVDLGGSLKDDVRQESCIAPITAAGAAMELHWSISDDDDELESRLHDNEMAATSFVEERRPLTKDATVTTHPGGGVARAPPPASETPAKAGGGADPPPPQQQPQEGDGGKAGALVKEPPPKPVGDVDEVQDPDYVDIDDVEPLDGPDSETATPEAPGLSAEKKLLSVFDRSPNKDRLTGATTSRAEHDPLAEGWQLDEVERFQREHEDQEEILLLTEDDIVSWFDRYLRPALMSPWVIIGILWCMLLWAVSISALLWVLTHKNHPNNVTPSGR